jgi:hypothetical protein
MMTSKFMVPTKISDSGGTTSLCFTGLAAGKHQQGSYRITAQEIQ